MCMPWFEPSSSGALSIITLYAWGRMRHSRGTAPASWLPRWTAVWCRCAVYRSPAAPHTRPALWCRCKCSAGHRSDAAWCHGWYCRPSTYTHTHTHTHTQRRITALLQGQCSVSDKTSWCNTQSNNVKNQTCNEWRRPSVFKLGSWKRIEKQNRIHKKNNNTKYSTTNNICTIK